MNRTRDLLWEALVKACHADDEEMTKSERGRYNKALKELREAGATPEEVGKRARFWRQTYPGASLTPTALATHWSALKPPPSPHARPNGGRFEGPPIEIDEEKDPLGLTEQVSPEQRQENLRKLRELIEGVGRGPEEV